MKTVLIGWFIVKAILPTEDGYLYSLLDPIHNYHVDTIVDHKLESEQDTWVQAKMIAKCDYFDDYYYVDTGVTILQLHKDAYRCEAESFQELKCNERNTFYVNGIGYCG